MKTADEKKSARLAAFARRKVAHEIHAEDASAALLEHVGGIRGQILAGYLPIRTEADPLPAMNALAAWNRVVVPVVQGAAQPLVFREWRPGCALEDGAFGVMVPVEGETLRPDVVIAPMLAFDRALYRLGYGGGFYDRTLEQLRQQGAVRAIGFAYSDQRMEALPLEPTDQPLDELVTEQGVLNRPEPG